MNEAKHTPGPWKVVFGKSGRPRAIEAPHDMHVPGGVGHIVRYNGIGFPSSQAAQANAHLIAAAPDMLAALQSAISHDCIGLGGNAQQYFRDNEASRKAIDLIRAAIAKATGEGSPVANSPSNAEELVP